MPRYGPTDEELDRAARAKERSSEAIDSFRERMDKNANLAVDLNTMMLLEAINVQTEVLVQILERLERMR